MSAQPNPVVCVSYLAHAALWKVPRFPQANHGAEVLTIENSIAADAPMTAAVLVALDVPAVLLANDVGDDTSGAEVHAWLQRHGITTTAKATAKAVTPQIVVVADNEGSRTWFPFLPGVADSLASLDLSSIGCASFVYIDCYQLIETPAIRAVQAARAAGVPLLLNLGGSAFSDTVAAEVCGHPRLVVQTNVDDDAHRDARQLAATLRSATNAQWAVVTAGASGVTALSETQHLCVPAFRAIVLTSSAPQPRSADGSTAARSSPRPISASVAIVPALRAGSPRADAWLGSAACVHRLTPADQRSAGLAQIAMSSQPG